MLDALNLDFLPEWRPNLSVDTPPYLSYVRAPCATDGASHLSSQRAPFSFRRGCLSIAHVVACKILHTPPPLYVHLAPHFWLCVGIFNLKSPQSTEMVSHHCLRKILVDGSLLHF